MDNGNLSSISVMVNVGGAVGERGLFVVEKAKQNVVQFRGSGFAAVEINNGIDSVAVDS